MCYDGCDDVGRFFVFVFEFYARSIGRRLGFWFCMGSVTLLLLPVGLVIIRFLAVGVLLYWELHEVFVSLFSFSFHVATSVHSFPPKPTPTLSTLMTNRVEPDFASHHIHTQKKRKGNFCIIGHRAP
jgi:hypothetical protein